MDNAEFLLGTVTAVSTSAGIKIQLDGQDAAMSKYYKILITGAEVPVIGERVAVMKHSGTYVVIGKIGMPSDNTGKVNRSGDTMTGLLNINRTSPGVIGKATARDSSETVAENTNSYGFRINDKNGNLVALYTDRYETTGENGAFIGGYRMVNGTNTGNNLRLLVDAAGNKLVYVTSPAAWRKALGLGTNGALPITVGQGGTGATSAAGHAVFAGPNSSTAAAPSFRALVADDIPNLNASKITAGTLPIGRGGTGSTGTATVTTLASIATAGTNITLLDASFCSWGKLAMLFVHGKTTAALTGPAVLFTVVSGKRPVSYAPVQIGRSPDHNALIGSNGQAQLGGSLSSGQEFSCAAVYLLP